MQLSYSTVRFTKRWLRCMLHAILVSSVLLTGEASSLLALEVVTNEESDASGEEKEARNSKKEGIAESFRRRTRCSTSNLGQWYHRTLVSVGSHNCDPCYHHGHCLSNGLRAPLLH
jgi:hypothetical protein